MSATTSVGPARPEERKGREGLLRERKVLELRQGTKALFLLLLLLLFYLHLLLLPHTLLLGRVILGICVRSSPRWSPAPPAARDKTRKKSGETWPKKKKDKKAGSTSGVAYPQPPEVLSQRVCHQT
jgi:hypothetical protein